MNFKKFFTRILIKASILTFCISSLFIQNTAGYFQDIEVSQGNTIETGTLDLGLRSGQSNFVSGADSMEPGDSVARDIYVQNLGNNPFAYKASYEYVSGDEDLCEGLQLRVWYNWYDAEPPAPGDHSTRHMDLKYFGALADFDDFDTNSPTHDPDMILPNIHPYYNNIFYQDNEHWFYYQIVLPQGAGYLLGKSCTFNIKVKAWQVGLEESESGFWDEEVIESSIATAQRCGEGGEAVDVAPIDRVNIGNGLSEQLHDIDGWSGPNLPGNYGGKDDGSYRQIIEETGCDEDGREAKFVLYAGSRNANLLRIRALDGMSNLDSFEVYVNDNLVGSYTDVQDSAEIWHTLEIPLNNLSGYLEVKLRAIDSIWPGCSQYGQVAISWAEINGYYCSPDEEIIPSSSEATCQEPNTPVVVDPMDEVNVGDATSESSHSLLGWSSPNLPGNYGGKDDGTYRQVISEQYCSDEYRVAGFTLDAGSQIANLLRLRVLDGISNEDGFDVYVNDEFLAHLPDLTQNHPEQWWTYEIPLPNLTGEIKVRLVAFDEFWNWCQTYGQVSTSWAQIAGYSCGETESSPVVLNEILPNPEGDDNQSGLDGEWVELYNNGAAPVDVTGWYIKDDSPSGNQQTISSSTTYNSQTVLGAKGSGTEWLVLFINGSILNNEGDTVTLYTNEDVFVDTYTFGVSANDDDSDSANTPGAPNSTVGEDPGNEGKSYARIPDGTGGWVDPDPTPGGPNRLAPESEEEINQKDEMEDQAEKTAQEGEIEQENETEQEIEIEEKAVNEDEGGNKESEEGVNDEAVVDEPGVETEEEVQQEQAELESEEEMSEVPPEEPEELEQVPSENKPEIEAGEAPPSEENGEEGVPPIPEEIGETNEEV